MELTCSNLSIIVGNVRAAVGAPEAASTIVEGCRFRLVADPAHLELHRADIDSMLDQLPVEFHHKSAGGGGGWSMLNACVRKDGVQWADFQTFVDILVCLGIAVGRAQWLLPRDMWNILPGGMPYFHVLEAGSIAKKQFAIDF